MTNPPPKSLEVLRRELDVQVQIQEKRAESADTRAGVVLGFAGIVAGVAAAATAFAIPGAIAAAVAVIRAAAVILPKEQLATLNPRYLTNTYGDREPNEAAWQVLQNRLDDYGANEQMVDSKFDTLKSAIRWLRGGTILVLTGVAIQTIVDLFVHEEGTQP